MPQCPKCHDLVSPEEEYCPNCGTEVTQENPEQRDGMPPQFAPVQPVLSQQYPPLVQQPVVSQPVRQSGAVLSVLAFAFGAIAIVLALLQLVMFLSENFNPVNETVLVMQMLWNALLALPGLVLGILALCKNVRLWLLAALGMVFSLSVLLACFAAVSI